MCKIWRNKVGNYQKGSDNRSFWSPEPDSLEKGIVEPLLLKSPENQQDEDEQEGDESEEASEDSHKPANSIVAAYRLLTPSVKVCSNYELLASFSIQ